MERVPFLLTGITNARIIHRVVTTRIVLWGGKDPRALNRTYNLAQVRFAWKLC